MFFQKRSSKFRQYHFTILTIIIPVIIAIVTGLLGYLFKWWEDRGPIDYKAQTRFMYSMDGGKTYATMQEIPVNKNFYMAIDMAVFPDKKTKKTKKVNAKIILESTKIVNCYLANYPGTSITGLMDTITGAVSYEFNLEASSFKTSSFRVIFDCLPLKEGKTRFQVVYDDSVADIWDATGTIKYVAPVEEKE